VRHLATVQARAGEQAAGGFAEELFDRYPYAIVLTDATGRVVRDNLAARRLLRGRVPTDEPGRPGGCELAGCRRRGTSLEDVCMHELALAQDGPPPEILVDLPRGAGADTAWVTVAALGTDPERIVMQLRPGAAEDRRRRTSPHWAKTPQLRIQALGHTRVLGPDGPLDGSWLDNRAGEILKYLVSERHRSVRADEIVEKLWPDSGVRGTGGLRYFIHVLRQQLEPDRGVRSPSSFVLATRGGYTLDDSRVWIDANDFEEHIEAGLAAYRRDDTETARDRLERGLALYEGDFLAEEPYAEWAINERDRLRGLAGEGLRAQCALMQRGGDVATALACMVRLTELEPFDLDVHVDLLVLLLRNGRRSEALRRYGSLRRRMLITFGEDLDFTIADLLPAAMSDDPR
jgi:DNA-binding SARP family transcriptional activator